MVIDLKKLSEGISYSSVPISPMLIQLTDIISTVNTLHINHKASDFNGESWEKMSYSNQRWYFKDTIQFIR